MIAAISLTRNLITAGIITALIAQLCSAQIYSEAYRPGFHFSPEQNWINDPNGLVYHDGEYHLYYQYNPFGNSWGNMSWGHATSTDLVRWDHQPVAILRDSIHAFSGSAVIDVNNTAGFGAGAMVAAYTGWNPSNLIQDQRIAYSTDSGTTFTKYANNPVIPSNSVDFRDPKVFWHQPTNDWVMAITRPASSNPQRPAGVEILRSPDLKNWTYKSTYGSGGWETPDLFELPVDGNPNDTRWVMMVAASGGTDYHIGQFDGDDFTAESIVRADYGQDFYAAQQWNNLPTEQERRVAIGWMSNWSYAGAVPTSPWRGAMSLPRELSLTQTGSSISVQQKPVPELQALRRELPFSLNFQPPPPLVDSLGNATDVSVTVVGDPVNTGAFAVNSSSSLFGNNATNAVDLMREYLIAFDEPQSVELGGLDPLGQYDLYLYGAGDRAIRNTVFSVSDNTGTHSAATAGVPESTHLLTPGIDYAVLQNLTAAADGTLSILYDNGPGSNEGPFNGFQIVARSGANSGQTINVDFGLTPSGGNVQQLFTGSGAHPGEGNAWNAINVVDQNNSINEFGEFGFFSGNVSVGGSLSGENLIVPGSDPLEGSGLEGDMLELIAILKPGTASRVGLKVREGAGEETLVGFDDLSGTMFVDRNSSGNGLTSGQAQAPLELLPDGSVKLHVFVDRSSVEVFGNDGQSTITSLIFPDPDSIGVSLFAEGGIAELVSLQAFRLANSFLPAADFDHDGDVDADDLLLWESAYANSGQADSNGDLLSNGTDFLVWQRDLGLTGTLAEVAQVPEPTSIALTVFSVIFTVLRARGIY